MLKRFLKGRNVSIDEFVKVLLDIKFNEQSAQNMIQKINKNHRFEDGDTLLDLCLRKNKTESANWLSSQGVEISFSNKDGLSTIRNAIDKNQITVLENLLNKSDVNIDQVDENQRSLLQDAVISGSTKIVKYLLSRNADVNIIDKYNKNVIFDAISYGDEILIDIILDVEGLELNNIDTSGSPVLLHKDVLKNDDLAIKLLQKGADPTICDKSGYNFLTYTALRGEEAKMLLELAIECSSNIDAKGQNSNTVLFEVVTAFSKAEDSDLQRRGELMDVAQLLIDKGSDINELNEHGETLLFEMIRKGDIQGCKFILRNHINVNLSNKNRETPLYLAVIKGIKFLDIVSLLLQKGADPLYKNKYNHTIPEVLNEIILYLHKNKKTEFREYIFDLDKNGQYMVILKEVLKQKNVDYNYRTAKGSPLFFETFMHGDLQATKLYLKAGLNINQKDSHGQNLFYRYVLDCFEKGEYFPEFQENLVFLLVNNSDIKATNKHGQTIFIRIALIKKCNLKLFRKLAQVTKFDYYAVDSLGRTIIHSCVLSDNYELFDIVFNVEKNIQNIADNYNVLPITYAALLGRKEIVWKLLKKDTIVNSGKPIALEIRKKLKPMLKNLSKLKEGVDDDPILMQHLTILAKQIVKDFA